MQDDDTKREEGKAAGTFIRTYAKDMAVATHTPPPARTAAPMPAPHSLEADVAAAGETGEYTPDVAPAETLLVPVEIPEAAAVDLDAKRAEILARLRTGNTSLESSGVLPQSSVGANEHFAAPAPLAVEASEYHEPSPSVPEPPAAGLRTYGGDFSQHLEDKDASAFSVIAAEQDAKRVPPARATTAPRSHTWLPVVAGILLLGGSGAGVYAGYVYMNAHATVAPAPTIPSLVVADTHLDLTGKDALATLASLTSGTIPQGTLVVTYLTETSSIKKVTTTVPAPGTVLIAKLALAFPELLVRNITGASTVGVIHAGSETRPFFILQTDSYERSFAAMLGWEGAIVSDLSLLYPSYPAVAADTASASSTTTGGEEQPPVFTDEVVSNHDVRALKDSHDNTLLLYGYQTKNILIIARDEAAFSLLLTRLQTSAGQ